MRLALVIASDYQQSPQAPTLIRSPEDADRFAGFLDQSESEIAIEELGADRSFPDQFEQVLAEQPGKLHSVIVYFSGCVVTAPGREPSLLLDGERLGAFALPRLRKKLEERARRVLVVIDAVAVVHDDASAEQVADAVGRALVRHSAISALVSIRAPEQASAAGTSFTDLLLFCWESSLGSDPSEAVLSVADVFESMRGEAAFEDLPAARYFPGRADFNVLSGSESEPEQEVSGLRLAAEGAVGAGSVPGLPLPAHYRAPLSRSSVPPPLPPPARSPLPPPARAPLPPPARSPLPPPAPASAGAVVLPEGLPAFPIPGAAAPLPPLPDGLAADAGPEGAARLPRSIVPDRLPQTRIAEAPSSPSLPARTNGRQRWQQLEPLQPSDPEIEDEVTEPGQPFGGIADETTVDSPLDLTPDTERDQLEQPSSNPPPRTEAEVFAAQDGGFADGEDTEVTEGFAGLVPSRLQPPPAAPAAGASLRVTGAVPPQDDGSATIAALLEQSLASELSSTVAKPAGSSIAQLVEESLVSESVRVHDEDREVSIPPEGELLGEALGEPVPSGRDANRDELESDPEPESDAAPDSEPLPAYESESEASVTGVGLPPPVLPTADAHDSTPAVAEAVAEAVELAEAEPLPSFGSEDEPWTAEAAPPLESAEDDEPGSLPSFESESESELQPSNSDAFQALSQQPLPSPPNHHQPEADEQPEAEEASDEPEAADEASDEPEAADEASDEPEAVDEPEASDELEASDEPEAPLPSFESEAMDESPSPPPLVLGPPLPPPALHPGALQPAPQPVASTPVLEARAPSIPDEGEAEAALSDTLAQPEPLPEPYEVCLMKGDEFLEQRDFPAAVAEYEKALTHAPADQAGVAYGRLGAVSRARGDYDGAITNFEIALELLPGDPAPLSALTELCLMQREFHAVEGYQRRFLEVQQDPEARSAAWKSMANLWHEHAKDSERYRAVLREWMADVPQALEPHRLLVADHEDTGEHALAVEARRRLAGLLDEPASKASELSEAVRGICSHLGDADYAVSVALQAVQLDPSALGALDTAAELLVQQERWQELARVYEQVLAELQDSTVQQEIGSKLGALYSERLESPERTISAYERVLEEDDTRVDLRRQLVELYSIRGEHQLALSHCRRALKAEPGNHELYRRAYGLLDKLGEADAAWNAAMVLDCLGEADINEQLVADAHRPSGLLPAKGTVSEDDWGHGLFAPERDTELSEVFAAILETAVELRATFLRKKRRAPKLEPDKKHDPNTSTTTLAKSLLWASKLLSVKPPELYVLEEVPGALSAAPAESPSALVSKSLARGLSLSQLAFLWGRQLALFRPEHYLAVFYPTVEELQLLLVAALCAGECPNLRAVAVDAEARRLAKDLKKKLHPGSYERLRAACRAFPSSQLEERVSHWLKTAELVSGRAGLLACGDVSIAAELIRKHPVRGHTHGDTQLSDVLCFAVSDEYAKLRGRLGVAIA